MALSPGDRLGSYDIVAPLGAGGMGEVYKARDTKLDRFVALKVLHTTRATDPAFRDRFQREAKAVAALTHPNIVTVHSIEEHDGTPFLTMELVEGRTLAQMIPAGGVSLDQLYQIAIPLADAVAAAHARGITHRDLKPVNVMVTGGGHLKVLDFGLAKLTETSAGVGGLTAVPTEQLTGHGQILGTVAYMSPEQAEGRPVDHRSDIFSVGIILYELATGRKPFTGDTSVSLLSSILRDTPASVNEINTAIPREIARLIRRCLEKNPAERLQSALDLKHELEDLRAEGTVSLTAEAKDKPKGLSSPNPTGGDQPSGLSKSKTWSSTTQASVVVPAPGRVLKWLAAAAALVLLAGAGYWTLTRRAAPGDALPASASPSAAKTLTVTRFENRTGDTSLDPLGQLAADAISQKLPQIEFLGKSGAEGPRTSAAVTGAYYLDGQNIRIQAALTDAAGGMLHTIEPAVAPRTDQGKAVDLVQQRMLGAIVTRLDPEYGIGALTHAPLYDAYREVVAGFDLFADEPARAATRFQRATEIDPDFFDAWHLLAASYGNSGDPVRARETVERMRTMSDRLSPFDRFRLAALVHGVAGRRLDSLKALRDAEQLAPQDLVTNFLIGQEALRLNRPQETLDEYAKLNADSWNRGTVGGWRYTRLTDANHLLSRHDEELRIAGIAKGLFPSSLGSRTSELAAMAALGRNEELMRSVDQLLAVTILSPTGTPGGSMRTTAEELRAHGRRAESIELARRAVAWYRSRPPEVQATPVARLALAQTLYVAENWEEAGRAVAALLKERPDNAVYIALAGSAAARAGNRTLALRQAAILDQLPSEVGGAVELRRAQLAALTGDLERAVGLLRDAFARGLAMSLGLHRSMDLESLRGYAPFDELMKPKG